MSFAKDELDRISRERSAQEALDRAPDISRARLAPFLVWGALAGAVLALVAGIAIGVTSGAAQDWPTLARYTVDHVSALVVLGAIGATGLAAVCFTVLQHEAGKNFAEYAAARREREPQPRPGDYAGWPDAGVAARERPAAESEPARKPRLPFPIWRPAFAGAGLGLAACFAVGLMVSVAARGWGFAWHGTDRYLTDHAGTWMVWGAAVGLALSIGRYVIARHPSLDARRWPEKLQAAMGLSAAIGIAIGLGIGHSSRRISSHSIIDWMTYRHSYEAAITWGALGAAIGAALCAVLYLTRR